MFVKPDFIFINKVSILNRMLTCIIDPSPSEIGEIDGLHGASAQILSIVTREKSRFCCSSGEIKIDLTQKKSNILCFALTALASTQHRDIDINLL